MRAVFIALVTSLALTGPLRAEGAGHAAIQGVISSQIEAFLADDFVTAFEFASPGIQDIFGTPERFGQMVRDGYPMVWRPDRVRFLDLREQGGRPVQRVMITDADGRVHLLDYVMAASETGWRIAGVYLLEGPAAGV